MTDPGDILSNGKGNLPEDKLMAYLEGKLSLEELHEVEQWLAEEGIEADALEGLHQLKSIEARDSVNRINHQLRRELLAKHHGKRKQIVNNPWGLLAIAIILLLVALAYIIIHMISHK